MIPPLKVKDRLILQTFDVNDPANMGRPLFWSLDNHIIAIEQMICADEIQMALKMCDEIPGWYRDNYPQELTEIKNTLYQQCYDQFDYSSDHDEANFTKDEVIAQCFSSYTYPRADILAEDLMTYQTSGKVVTQPWLFEISPSHGWLPVGFDNKKLKFNFFGKNLNQKALAKIKEWLTPGVWQEKPALGQEKWLINFESLEHMWFPHDLEQASKKMGHDWDRIYLSTPKYTLGCGLSDWRTRRLGHVRTWSPGEFSEFAKKAWPGYTWSLWPAHSMVLVGKKP
jgi:hypothetical protein